MWELKKIRFLKSSELTSAASSWAQVWFICRLTWSYSFKKRFQCLPVRAAENVWFSLVWNTTCMNVTASLTDKIPTTSSSFLNPHPQSGNQDFYQPSAWCYSKGPLYSTVVHRLCTACRRTVPCDLHRSFLICDPHPTQPTAPSNISHNEQKPFLSLRVSPILQAGLVLL